MQGKKPDISENRKTLFYLGTGLMGLGFLLFLSNFFVVARGPMAGPGPLLGGPEVNPFGGFAFRGIGGMVLMMAGALLRTVGIRGAAGSGLILDPKQAREDLSPWARTAGGLVKDALAEVREEPAATGAQPAETGAQAAEVVKVRCPHCRALNDEDAKYCDQCGGAL